ncbi:hypothetical protein D3C72_1208310 [compost metagenome]
MIVFQVVQDRGARAVVDKLAALVEEGGVVLVGLDHEGRAVAQAGRHAEVQRHAADQEAGRLAALFEHPGQHRGGGRLAVRAGHGQHMAALQHVLGQPLRAAGVGLAGVEDGFHQRELGAAVGQPGPRDHVADHEHVGGEGQLVGAEAFDQVDAERAQLVAHRGVHAGVAARDPVACFACEGGHTTHERAADTQNMNVHRPILGRRCGCPGRFAPGAVLMFM